MYCSRSIVSYNLECRRSAAVIHPTSHPIPVNHAPTHPTTQSINQSINQRNQSINQASPQPRIPGPEAKQRKWQRKKPPTPKKEEVEEEEEGSQIFHHVCFLTRVLLFDGVGIAYLSVQKRACVHARAVTRFVVCSVLFCSALLDSARLDSALCRNLHGDQEVEKLRSGRFIRRQGWKLMTATCEFIRLTAGTKRGAFVITGR